MDIYNFYKKKLLKTCAHFLILNYILSIGDSVMLSINQDIISGGQCIICTLYIEKYIQTTLWFSQFQF